MKAGCEGEAPKKKVSIALPVLASAPDGGVTPRKSRTARWRAGALIALNLLMIAHVIQWAIQGRTVSPIEPSEAMYTLQQGAVNAGVIFFSLALLATLIFGRFVCGWGCHIVALQDLCAWLMNKIGLKPRPFRSRLLMFVPLIAGLYMFVWPVVARSITKPPNEPLIPQFTNHLITTEFWATFPPWWVAVPFLFVCGFMTVYFLGAKGFCTYGCPYGGFFAVADKVAPGRIRVTDACNQCGHCTAACTSNVLVHAEVNQFGMVVDPGCMKCMDCVSVCPNDALYFGFGKPAGAIGKKAAKNFPLTWPEEVFAAAAFVLSYFAVWNVYQLVPMLMALGIAAVTAFVALRTLRLLRSRDSAFYGRALKAGGSLRAAGWLFIAFAAVWLGLNVHSGWIRYHERAGNMAFERLQVPDELALAQLGADRWLGPSDRANIDAGVRELAIGQRFGLITNTDTLPKLAWMTYLAGDSGRAAELLNAAAQKSGGQAKALSLYYRGAILNRAGKPDEAMRSLDQALMEAPNLVLAREEKGEALWTLGRKQEAAAVWSDAIRGSAGLPLANYFLAGANVALGKPDAAFAYELQADNLAPADAYYQWMLGTRLKNIGMTDLAKKRFDRAMQIDPQFRSRLQD